MLACPSILSRKLFGREIVAKYSNQCDHVTKRHGQTDGRIDDIGYCGITVLCVASRVKTTAKKCIVSSSGVNDGVLQVYYKAVSLF